MIHTREEQMEAFGRFLDILDELRGQMSVGPQADERKSAPQHYRRDLRAL